MTADEMEARAAPQSPAVATSMILAFTFGFIGFASTAAAGLFLYLHINAPDALNAPVERRFPAPALQISPQADLKQFENEQQAALNGYHWVDRAKGIARIPIEEAMTIIAARGARAYDAPAGSAQQPPPATTTGGSP
jgi:hypothetical protein